MTELESSPNPTETNKKIPVIDDNKDDETSSIYLFSTPDGNRQTYGVEESKADWRFWTN